MPRCKAPVGDGSGSAQLRWEASKEHLANFGYDDLGCDVFDSMMFFFTWAYTYLMFFLVSLGLPSAEDAQCCMYGLWGSVNLGYTADTPDSAIFLLFFEVAFKSAILLLLEHFF